MKFIQDLHDIAENNKSLPLVVLINDKTIELTCQFYIEDEVCYYFLKSKKFFDEPLATTDDILYGIEAEAEDDCWNNSGWGANNTYCDCEVRIAESENEDEIEDATIYEIEEIKIIDNKVVIQCELDS